MNAFLSGKKLIVSLLALVISVGTLALLFSMYRNSNMVPLFNGLSDQDTGMVVKKLEQLKVGYRLDNQGGILVDGDKEKEIKVNLAASGFELNPQQGFELFDKADYGLNEFSQSILLQRALQGELAKTVSLTQGVASARVHVVLAHQGLFQKKEEAKASVSLVLDPGVVLSKEQVSGIQEVVASAVDGLQRHQVVVADANGRILSSDSDDDSFKSALANKQQFENYLQHKAETLLINVFGYGNFSVIVDVAQDLSERQTETTTLTPYSDRGQGFLVRDKVSRNEMTQDKSNSDKSIINYDKGYEFGTKKEKINFGIGKIQRITVSVVVPLEVDSSDISNIKILIANGLGLDDVRGDKIDVLAMLRLKKIEENTSLAKLNQSEQTGKRAGFEDKNLSELDSAKSYFGKYFLEKYLWIGLLVVFLLVALMWSLIFKLRANNQNLSAKEREELLAEIRQWIRN